MKQHWYFPLLMLAVAAPSITSANADEGNKTMTKETDGIVHVGMTLPEDRGAPLAEQAASVFSRVLAEAAKHGLGAKNIGRTRIFVSDISAYQAVAAAHKQAFGALGPATAMLQLAHMPADGVHIAAEAVALEGEATTVKSGSALEDTFGFSSAVRAGDHLFVTGTVGTGKDIAADDFYSQTKRALEKTRAIAEQAGARLEDVVQTRIFIREFAGFEDVARAHREVFGDILPATTLIEVNRLFTPDMAVEVEADIYLGEKQRIGSDSKWEPWFGFSRSYLAGPRLRISGSTGHGETVTEQTETTLDNLARAAGKAGHVLSDAVSIRVFARDSAKHADDIRRAIAKRVDLDRVAWSLIDVEHLAGDAMLVEIEADTVRATPDRE